MFNPFCVVYPFRGSVTRLRTSHLQIRAALVQERSALLVTATLQLTSQVAYLLSPVSSSILWAYLKTCLYFQGFFVLGFP